MLLSWCTGNTDPQQIEQSQKIEVQNSWTGPILSHTEDETTLSYNGKILKTWSHTPPNKIPFIWDEGCELLSQKLQSTPSDIKNMDGEKQKAWESLTETGKKSCIKENLTRSLRTESTNDSRFISVLQSRYEGYSRTLIDAETGKSIENLQELLVWVTNLNNFIIVHTRSNHDTSDEVLIFSPSFDLLKKWTDETQFILIDKIERGSDDKTIKLITTDKKEIIITL